ncbi:Uncharacterised protein [Segatella copri]|nr:Uncharacterised protein [Segatella copri]
MRLAKPMKSSLFCILMHILNHVASTCSWVNSFWSPVMVVADAG